MRPRPQYSIEEDRQGGAVVVIRIPIVAVPESVEVKVPMLGDMFFARLSPREEEVYTMLMLRKADKQIAAALHISVRTVKYHVSSILRKAHCETRAELWFRVAG